MSQMFDTITRRVQEVMGSLSYPKFLSSIYDSPIVYDVIYVRTTGNDISGDGTLANPYRTLVKALEGLPVIAASSRRYFIDITGIEETLPADFVMPPCAGGAGFTKTGTQDSLYNWNQTVNIVARPRLTQEVAAADMSFTEWCANSGPRATEVEFINGEAFSQDSIDNAFFYRITAEGLAPDGFTGVILRRLGDGSKFLGPTDSTSEDTYSFYAPGAIIHGNFSIPEEGLYSFCGLSFDGTITTKGRNTVFQWCYVNELLSEVPLEYPIRVKNSRLNSGTINGLDASASALNLSSGSVPAAFFIYASSIDSIVSQYSGMSGSISQSLIYTVIDVRGEGSINVDSNVFSGPEVRLFAAGNRVVLNSNRWVRRGALETPLVFNDPSAAAYVEAINGGKVYYNGAPANFYVSVAGETPAIVADGSSLFSDPATDGDLSFYCHTTIPV